jgi:hypothetical protein
VSSGDVIWALVDCALIPAQAFLTDSFDSFVSAAPGHEPVADLAMSATASFRNSDTLTGLAVDSNLMLRAQFNEGDLLTTVSSDGQLPGFYSYKASGFIVPAAVSVFAVLIPSSS